jgi:hypothetical protein
VIGEVAEAVAEVCLVEVGYHLVAEVGGAGRHGVDAIVLDPAGERLVNLADRCFRVGFTRDFEVFAPVTDVDRLVDLSWLDDVPLP